MGLQRPAETTASSGRRNGSAGPTAANGIPRLALSKSEAAEALGCSVDFLEQHVLHELRVVRRGRRRLIPVRELEQWLLASASRALEGRP